MRRALRRCSHAAVRRRLVSDVPDSGPSSAAASTRRRSAAYAPSDGAGPGRLNTFKHRTSRAELDESALRAPRGPARALAYTTSACRPSTLARELAPARVLTPASTVDRWPTAPSCLTYGVLSRVRARARDRESPPGGDGADELFAGLRSCSAPRLARLYASLRARPSRCIAPSSRWSRRGCPLRPIGNMSLDFKLKLHARWGSRLRRRVSWCPLPRMAPVAPADLHECARLASRPEEVYREAIAAVGAGRAQASDVDKSAAVLTPRLYLQHDIPCKVDRASMMHFALEVRAPFLDIELVISCARCPLSAKPKRQRNRTGF